MLYGDLVTLSPGGVLLGSKAVLPIGIFDRSICWGVWVPDATRPEQERDAHLVISPLHPRYWPYLLRFELKLKEEMGCMAAAASKLREHGMNILFGESSPSGHHHATWNVVCEAVEVRATFEQRIQAFKGRKGHRSDRKRLNMLASELADAIYGAAHRVRKAMIDEGDFLHERIVTDTPKLLHDFNRMKDPDAIAAAREDTLQPVRFRWIQNLPKFSFYAVDALHPQAFLYDQKRSILHAEQHDGFERMLRMQGLTELPTRAIASIYPEEHHVRLIPRHKHHLARVVQIDLKYIAHFMTPPATRPHSGDDTSMGLWADACRKLAGHGLNLQRVTNKTLRHVANAEEGVLTLIGVHEDPEKPLDIAALRAELGNLPPELRDRIRLVDSPAVGRLTVEKVFISRRMNAPDGTRAVQIASERARFYGLQPVVVDSPGGVELEGYITERIRECDAMFQIVTMSRQEFDRVRREPSYLIPQLHWISFEYGVAAGRGLPVARILDESALSMEEWKTQMQIGVGGVLHPFDARDPSGVEKTIDRAMHELARLVHGDPADT